MTTFLTPLSLWRIFKIQFIPFAITFNKSQSRQIIKEYFDSHSCCTVLFMNFQLVLGENVPFSSHDSSPHRLIHQLLMTFIYLFAGLSSNIILAHSVFIKHVVISITTTRSKNWKIPQLYQHQSFQLCWLSSSEHPPSMQLIFRSLNNK